MNSSPTKETIRSVNVADLHFGTPKVPASLIPRNLRKYLHPRLQDGTVDFLFIPGDVYDAILGLNATESFHAMQAVDELMELAIAHDFFIRVCDGTFKHDRGQNHCFMVRGNIPPLLGMPRVRTVDQLTVERFEPLGVSVAYMPDDLPLENPLEELKTQMRQLGLEQVDFLLRHGFWVHMLPPDLPNPPRNTLDWEQVQPLIRGAVINGHEHQPSIHGRVVSCGSFDRQAHGEEHAKGFFVVDYDKPSGRIDYEFVKNEGVTIFATFNAMGEAWPDMSPVVDAWLARLKRQEDQPNRPYLRVLSNDPTLRQSLTEYLANQWPGCFVSSEDPTKRKRHTAVTGERPTPKHLPVLTPANLAGHVTMHLASMGDGLPQDDVEWVLALRNP